MSAEELKVMAVRRPFWKGLSWKSKGIHTGYGHWSLELIYKTKLKLELGNTNSQYGHQAAIIEVTSVKVNNLSVHG